MSEKVSTLTIRLTAEEAAQLERLKELTGKTTGSEALKYVMREYPRFVEHYKANAAKYAAKEQELKQIKQAACSYIHALQKLQEEALQE